jgi:hypothetical protein
MKYKIVESIPDKNGTIIIAIKSDPTGIFETREDALTALRSGLALIKVTSGKEQLKKENLTVGMLCAYESGFDEGWKALLKLFDDEIMKKDSWSRLHLLAIIDWYRCGNREPPKGGK